MISTKPNDKRAKTAILLIYIVMVLDVLTLGSGFMQYQLLDGALTVGIDTDAASANDLREQVIGILYMIVYIVSVVTFIMWFRRAYYNLHQHVRPLLFSEGWAAGSWFVPFLNLFRPYQIMKELYTETKHLLARKELSYSEQFTTRYLGVWWAFWIVTSFLGQFVFRYSLRADTVDELLTTTIAGMAESILNIPLGFLAVKIIKDYSAMEPLVARAGENIETVTETGDYLTAWAETGTGVAE